MKNVITGLVVKSYKNDQLDPEIVELVGSRLNRRELKQYIRLLKQEENKKQVIVTVPKSLTDEERDMIQKLFTGKKIYYTVDPSMISGIRIVDNDVEYEISLDQIFQNLIAHVSRLN
jgi:F0F1-type ATP synthase delta subunit